VAWVCAACQQAHAEPEDADNVMGTTWTDGNTGFAAGSSNGIAERHGAYPEPGDAEVTGPKSSYRMPSC
jgi:hypothetical protein